MIETLTRSHAMYAVFAHLSVWLGVFVLKSHISLISHTTHTHTHARLPHSQRCATAAYLSGPINAGSQSQCVHAHRGVSNEE